MDEPLGSRTLRDSREFLLRNLVTALEIGLRENEDLGAQGRQPENRSDLANHRPASRRQSAQTTSPTQDILQLKGSRFIRMSRSLIIIS